MVKPNVPKQLKSLKTSKKDLVSMYRMLPKVDGNGYSECPMAEDIYTEKEKRQQQVQLHLDQLRIEERKLLQEIKRVKHTVVILDNDKTSIHNNDSYEEYEQAQAKQQNHLKILRDKLGDIRLRINDLEILVGITRQKQWPTITPKQGNCFENYSPAMINKPPAKHRALPTDSKSSIDKADSLFRKESKASPGHIAKFDKKL